MSTDSPIPERWRGEYNMCEEGFPISASTAIHVFCELGKAENRLAKEQDGIIDRLDPEHDEWLKLTRARATAESLVRDLVRVLQRAVNDAKAKGSCWDWDNFIDEAKELLSRIPAHLRAPETSSTCESSSVLRKEEAIAENCKHWSAGQCQMCGVPWQSFEVSPSFHCEYFTERGK